MSRFAISATWDDVAHLTEDSKRSLFEGVPPHQRDARSKGVPQLGSGAIYPIAESEIVIDPFPVPDFWPRGGGLDVGWNRTAGIVGARDPETGKIFLVAEHYVAHAEASENVRALKKFGEWLPWVIDPAARGRSQVDGRQLLQNYLDLGLDVEPADNSVESGVWLVWQLLVANQLKVFKSLANWLTEFRLYRRDDNGKIVKKLDHLQDATRYLMVSGRDRFRTAPVKKKNEDRYYSGVGQPGSWMG